MNTVAPWGEPASSWRGQGRLLHSRNRSASSGCGVSEPLPWGRPRILWVGLIVGCKMEAYGAHRAERHIIWRAGGVWSGGWFPPRFAPWPDPARERKILFHSPMEAKAPESQKKKTL